METKTACLAVAGLAALLSLAHDADAASFVIVRDDGSIADPNGPSVSATRKVVLDGYEATGKELPEILSVWTAFPMNGSDYGTRIDIRANDVSGIGLEHWLFPPTGLKEPSDPPLRAILFHSNAFELPKRAALHRAPESAYGRYLFLLELSHVWGPTIKVPSPLPDELIGFPFHWSFFMDAGGSPAGGNVWVDNGDGTFTTAHADPGTLRYSMLDLYLMGLATPDEVAPFSVLEPTQIPNTPTDPFWGGAYAAHSLPWFDVADTMTVTATRRTLTIDDVIATNGARSPAPSTKTSFTLGVVLVVAPETTDDEIAAFSAEFEPFAASLAPAFEDATSGRATMELVSDDEPAMGGAGGAGGGAGAGGDAASGGAGGAAAGGAAAGGGGDGATDSGSGCACRSTGGAADASSAWWVSGLLGVGLAVIRRARLAPRGSGAPRLARRPAR
ncbi:MAG: hypothetical protein U0271_26505 [Polyangiaceae bacterium]